MGFRSLFATVLLTCSVVGAAPVDPVGASVGRSEYRLLATSKTSTMEREMNDAASGGFVFSAVMGGETAFGGKETVVVMRRSTGASEPDVKMRYRLLATSKTSTLQKELNDAGREGFVYRGVTVFESAFGGREVAVIVERPAGGDAPAQSYRVLATSKTSTMDRELQEAGADGFRMQGMCVGKTAFGGHEVISILMRPAAN
jgi:hypothetical protein